MDAGQLERRLRTAWAGDALRRDRRRPARRTRLSTAKAADRVDRAGRSRKGREEQGWSRGPASLLHGWDGGLGGQGWDRRPDWLLPHVRVSPAEP